MGFKNTLSLTYFMYVYNGIKKKTIKKTSITDYYKNSVVETEQ